MKPDLIHTKKPTRKRKAASKTEKLGVFEGYLKGKLLLASAALQQGGFAQSVIFMCEHDENGAVGFIVNRQAENITARQIYRQMQIDAHSAQFPIGIGGPVEGQRGFIIHTPDYTSKETVPCGALSVTFSTNILQDIAAEKGPAQFRMVLGYSGWGSTQLEAEIQQGSWLVSPYFSALVFDSTKDSGADWRRAMKHIGVDPVFLAAESWSV